MRSKSLGGAGFILLVTAAVVIPTAAVMWFLGIAMEHVEIAAREQLEQAFDVRLGAAVEALELSIDRYDASLDHRCDGKTPRECFAAIAKREGTAYVALQNGTSVYPDRAARDSSIRPIFEKAGLSAGSFTVGKPMSVRVSSTVSCKPQVSTQAWAAAIRAVRSAEVAVDP